MTCFVTSFEEIGRAEGRIEGQRDLVLRLLRRKVGSLDEAVAARVVSLAPEALLTLSEALLDFTDQSDLAAWLERNASQGAS